MFEWFKSNTSTSIVTIYPTNLTLNSSAAEYFDDIRWCMIGLDKKTFKIAIRPVTKRELDLKLFPTENLHKLSIGKGYARISSKSIISEVSSILNEEIDSKKYISHYDEKEKMLIVDLKKEV